MTNELYHHGRLNQRWGVRNGPPYPLSRATVKRVYSGKRRGLLSSLAERKEKKEAEKRAKEEKQKEEEKARRVADKERALKEGSASDLLPYLDELTTQELQNAANRIKWTQTIQEYALKERSKEWSAVNKTMKKVGDVKDWAKTGVELWEQLDKAMKLASGDSKDSKDSKESNKNKDKKK